MYLVKKMERKVYPRLKHTYLHIIHGADWFGDAHDSLFDPTTPGIVLFSDAIEDFRAGNITSDIYVATLVGLDQVRPCSRHSSFLLGFLSLSPSLSRAFVIKYETLDLKFFVEF